jgi:fibronectin-binding autotransporter adhesin
MKKILFALMFLCSNAFGQAGFETGNLTGWTTSGSDVTASQALINYTAGGGKNWTINPYGSWMGKLYPSGSIQFDNATASLGLTSTENTAIRQFMNANAGGGNPTPTNASWIKRSITLSAGTTYSFAWNYLSTDYTPFNDGSMITLVHSTKANVTPTLNNSQQRYGLLGFTNPGTGNYSTDSYGSTGWQRATFTVPETGEYVLGFATFNLGDTALSPMLFIDEMQGTTLLNGATFDPIDPNPGSTAPPASGGGGSEPAWPATSDITVGQSSQKTSAKSRVSNITLGNSLHLEQKVSSSSNSVTVEQTGNYNKIAGVGGGTYAIIDGDNNTVNIKQGDTLGKNLIEFNITGNSNNVGIWQARNPITGLQDGSESGGHYIGLKITGGGNTSNLRQSNDGSSSSGHFAYIDITGNSNNTTLRQTGNGEKTFFGIVNGNSNVFTVTQQGFISYLDLSLTGNGHSVTADQKDAGSHKATINLTNAGGASIVDLVQQSTTAQNINITQQCATLAGCSVSVTQGQ